MSQWYREQLRDPRWQQRRLEIFQRDQWQCQRCGAFERELQVHHRWYSQGRPPWESPTLALITLCCRCHEDVTMEMKPQIQIRDALVDTYGQIRTARLSTGDWYLAQADVEQVVREHVRHKPDRPTLRDVIWLDYLKWQGGDKFRRETEEDLRKDPDRTTIPPLQFDDTDGVQWLLSILALHFVSRYYAPLEYKVFRHFDKHVVKTIDATSLPQNGADSLDLIASFHKSQGMVLQQLMTHRDTLSEHEALIQEHTQKIEALETRPSAKPGRIVMREFVMTRLNLPAVSDKQIKDWGIELSEKIRQKNPSWTGNKILDPLAKRYINTYTIQELENFFRQKGLLR